MRRPGRKGCPRRRGSSCFAEVVQPRTTFATATSSWRSSSIAPTVACTRHGSRKPYLAVIQLKSSMRPSPLFMFRNVVKDFAEAKGAILENLQAQPFMEFVCSDKEGKDVDRVGFWPHRAALFKDCNAYCVKDVLMTIDEATSRRTSFAEMNFERLVKKPNLVMYIPAEIDVEIKQDDEM
ncbi:unnamed protein product [Prorocentrum cordatum]|uniref:Uncharacterized protein n=1 Tax=Prorocentrum cordatum TaxID=2364126 RepID=A0ABN9TJ47_9DINO|nr:unnamed protein product [Polarella glacialis]